MLTREDIRTALDLIDAASTSDRWRVREEQTAWMAAKAAEPVLIPEGCQCACSDSEEQD
jgi:hypothetical protein